MHMRLTYMECFTTSFGIMLKIQTIFQKFLQTVDVVSDVNDEPR